MRNPRTLTISTLPGVWEHPDKREFAVIVDDVYEKENEMLTQYF